MVLLVDMYLNLNKLDEAKQILHELKTNNPEFILDKFKVVKMAELIAKTDGIESKYLFVCVFYYSLYSEFC